MGKKTTTTPSGLKVTRNGNKMICEWTTHDYESQTFQINVNDQRWPKTAKGHKKGDIHWHTLTVGASTHKKTITTGDDKYSDGTTIPIINNHFRFRVKAKSKKKKESGYSKACKFTVQKMGTPTYVLPALWDNTTDTYLYTWSQHAKDGARASSHKIFKDFYWKTVLMDNGVDPDWNLCKTQKITIVDPSTHVPSTNQNSYGTSTATNPQIIIAENAADIEANKVRYFIVKTRSRRTKKPIYDSAWQKKFVVPLGAPKSVDIGNENVTFGSTDSNGTTATINFAALDTEHGSEYKMPNVYTEVQYAITQPYVSTTQDAETDTVKSSILLPNDYSSWTTDSNGKFLGSRLADTYVFRTTATIPNDSCLFLRVMKSHDGRSSYGSPQLVSRSPGTYKLSNPVIGSINVTPVLTKDGIVSAELSITVTNSSSLAAGGNKSFIAVYVRSSSIQDPEKPIGIIPYTSSSAVTSAFPISYREGEEASVSIGVQCLVADYSPINRHPSNVTEYTIDNIQMDSERLWEDNAVPQPPQNVTVSRHSTGIAHVTWEWNWTQANGAEISWSTDKILWQSTEAPSTYVLSNTRIGEIYITGLDATTYYIRIRFIKTEGETASYGTYSDFAEISMASAPNIPVLQLVPEDTAAMDDEITAYWRYSSTDGTSQNYAELTETWEENGEWVYADSETWLKSNSEKITFTPKEMGWTEGTSHYMCVRVTSNSLKTCGGWSNPKLINVASKPTISVSGIGTVESDPYPLRPKTITLDDGSSYTYPLALHYMPITCNVSGADSGGYVTATITRADDFEILRPDDSTDQGYKDEVIFSSDFLLLNETDTSVPVTINLSDIEGSLDDTASYTLSLTVTDSYGQTTEPVDYDFTVMWDRQAEKPTAQIQIIEENDIALIRPIAPSGALSGDHCEIYRLSADRPVLIKANATFGEQYVDEYPTFGDFGGYRIVHVTEFGDYTTEDRDYAWVDYEPDGEDDLYLKKYDKFAVAIEFDGDKVEFIGNVSLSHSWAKDFQTTTYLGGSVEGDWNPGIVRSGSINSTMPIEDDPESVYKMRLLADYAGICHVRTPDGSNFYADVQAKDDREEKWTTRIAKVSLSYTAVDNIEDDIPTYNEWHNTQ